MKCAAMRTLGFVGLLAATTLGAACGPAEVPSFALTARPKTVDDLGMEATITAEVLEDDGKPRAGTVKITSTAGAFSNGNTEQRLTLTAEGTATARWSCEVAADANCAGSIRIDGRWDDPKTGQFLVAAMRIDVKGTAP